jgi:hypothetical protein
VLAVGAVGDRGPGCVPRVKTAARIPREPGQQQHGGDDGEDPPEHHDETERDQQHKRRTTAATAGLFVAHGCGTYCWQGCKLAPPGQSSGSWVHPLWVSGTSQVFCNGPLYCGGP